MTQYDTTVRYFDHAANLMGLSKNMQALLLIPERELKVQVTLERDNGEIATFIGYRVQHDSARGPMKGGLRYHHEVDADEVRVAEIADGLAAILLAPAPQIAAGETAEHRDAARLGAFALQREEQLFNGVAHVRSYRLAVDN